MRERSVDIRRYGLDVLIGLAALAGALEVTLRSDASELRMPRLLAGAAVALVVLLLLARRRAPFAVPAALWLLVAALSFADGRLVVFPVSVYAAGMAAAFLLGNLRDAVQRRVGLAIAVGGAAIIMINDPDRTASGVVLLPAMFALAWLAGFAQRERAVEVEAAEERARHAESEREAAARVAVAEERARIARELHDIVAHAVSVMVLQVGAVRHRLPDTPAEHADALRAVEQTGRTALTELRRQVGAMRHEGEEAELAPLPGLGRLDALIDEIRRAGLSVHLRVEGTAAAIPGAIDLSAYRIVQEGLTNVLKHARAERADVILRYADDALEIDVYDDGDGSADDPNGRVLGHGLLGVLERVKVYGGEMRAGNADERGFLLSARLPLSGARP